ncbi:MFS transporter [Rothia uropygialis]|uniref:MFS transporter n=1 Tax=Kocuria sp. 36 TaxID=1415402 RepID=UPI00101CD82D|nr:MFS transporter [Kocuria sp. 36]
MSTAPADSSAARRLGPAIVTVALLGAVIGGVGAPLITSVALNLRVSLDAAQWTLTFTLFSGAIAAPVLGRLGAGSHRRATILITLALVAVGGLLTAIPLPFGVLLIGRALQGLGLGVVALLMSVARDHLPAERAHTTIATVSVASTVGIGVAYPLMGFIDQLAGLHIAYGVGFLLSLAAVLIAWRTIPQDAPRPPVRVDIPGAVLLGLGSLGVLLVVAQPSVWKTPWIGVSILAAAVAALWAWVVIERRATAPLVDLNLFTKGAVLRANTAMLTSGIGMYLLFSLLTRYVQSPPQAGYGFGLSGVLAGAALIPFSVLGFVAGRLTPWLTSRVPARWTFVIFVVFVVIAAGLFAATPSSLAATLLAMAVLGFGVGGISAIMPRLVLDGIPQPETSSVLSINQIVRSVGFSIGSAFAGLLLATATPAGSLFPDEHGYTTAALYVLPLLLLSSIAVLASRASTKR